MTLAHLFSLSEGSSPFAARSGLDSAPAVQALRQALAPKVPNLPWALVRDGILARVSELLDIPIVDVLAGAWNRYRILAKYQDLEKYPPEETYVVPLAKHIVSSEHHPYIEVTLGEAPVAKLVFDLSLSLTLEGFAVKIQGARIKAIETGSLQGKGTVSVAGAPLLERSMAPIQLPGILDLGEGIALGYASEPTPPLPIEPQRREPGDWRETGLV